MMISVIIPSYNSWPLIGETLQSLSEQKTSVEFEIIVADCSTDGSDRKIAEMFPSARLLHKDAHDYPGAARNRAIDNAKGEIIAMIDADAKASEDWIDRISLNFETNPDVTGFGGAIENARKESRSARVAHLLEFGGYTPSWNRRKVRMTPTCNLALKKNVFDSARFLEDWFGNEDVLIADHINRTKGTIIFDPQMLVCHYTRDSWAAIFDHQKRLGLDTGRTRYQFDLPGSYLAHNPLAMMLIPSIKYLFLLKRVFSYDREYLADFLSCNLQVIKALNSFAAGFRDGVSLQKKS
jgi:glycosyltransferase involved in cell wall biosynthesis